MSEPNHQDLEKRSSAYTLSDMEIFIFPELMYSLVLANIMSPRLWKWRQDPWFDGMEKMTPYRRITRLKQFIMDHYIFNLDLDTWGLTTQERELARFKDFIDQDTLAKSNALFGYQGDKYYFDSGIRQHFGLDKYEGNVIPYWKTETVEAMDAFRFKPAYPTGAGECVSLATLYAAALFVVAGVPLKQIYLMATPLHSQNYVDIGEGILTNNRRLVTKNMWFNGTELSAQARRALENERVTVVAHETGYIHTIYETATIDPEAYDHFAKRLRHYLRTPLTVEILGNFIRQSSEVQHCFQLRWQCCGADAYVPLEKVFAYERDSPYLVTDNTRDKLMQEIDREVFEPRLLPDRIVLNDLEAFARDNRINLDKPRDVEALKEKFACGCLNAKTAIESLVRFCHLEPRLPDAAARKFTHGAEEALGIEAGMGRDRDHPAPRDAAAVQFYGRSGVLRLPGPQSHGPRTLRALLDPAQPGVGGRKPLPGRGRAGREDPGHAQRVHLRRGRPPGPAGRSLELSAWRRRREGHAAGQSPARPPSFRKHHRAGGPRSRHL